jgi:hypothetical protein
MAYDAPRTRAKQPVVTAKWPATPPMTAPFKQPLAGAGVELSARPVTATAKAAGSNIAFISNSSDGLLLVAQQTPAAAGSRMSASRKGEAKLSNCKWKETSFEGM